MINDRNGLPVESIEMFEAIFVVWFVFQLVIRICGANLLTQMGCGKEIKGSFEPVCLQDQYLDSKDIYYGGKESIIFNSSSLIQMGNTSSAQPGIGLKT